MLVAVGCFHAAYSSLHYPAAGLLMCGYAFALVRLTHQGSVRRAFYFGLAAGFLCYAPQLWFFFKIFNAGAVVLWLAFWLGLFAAIVCACIRRWSRASVILLIPIVWTGLEYFRSELYYLKFSWLNAGYALSPVCDRFGGGRLGMYGLGFAVFLLAASYPARFAWNRFAGWLALVAASLMLLATFAVRANHEPSQPVRIAGVQMEFPPEKIIPKMLDSVFAKNTNAQIFVLSEYTLAGPVPPALKEWCREHARYLVVGGEDPAGNSNYYDTAFVVGTNGDIVFRQGKCVPIQFFQDGLPAPAQQIWDSPWGKIGFCVCYDLSYTRVTDELIRQGAQLLIVPTMDVEDWSRHEHELHTRVAPARAAEYGVPIFRLASSGISQAVAGDGEVVAQAPMPGTGQALAATLWPAARGSLPLDRFLAPACTALTGVLLVILTCLARKERNGARVAANLHAQ